MANGSVCDFDFNDCIVGDICLDGFCVKGFFVLFDDVNLCIKDACVKGEVVYVFSVEG